MQLESRSQESQKAMRTLGERKYIREREWRRGHSQEAEVSYQKSTTATIMWAEIPFTICYEELINQKATLRDSYCKFFSYLYL